MNCFSARGAAYRLWLFPAIAAALAACGVPDSESADRDGVREYSIHYVLAAQPDASAVRVTLRLRQPRGLLRELSFPIDPDINDVAGDGIIRSTDGRVVWLPPPGGGTLEWTATVRAERGDGSFDALLTRDWGVFRMEDVVPRARTRTLKGSVSRTTLRFDVPTGWSAISEYSATDSPIVVDRPERRFDQPTGWIAMGRLGVRRETIAGTRVAVVGPEGHDIRRLEMLAMLNWTLPELVAILPRELPRLTIVSASNPMWRGGLSAPASFFLHADRPLISENATSPLLHEVMHTALRIRTSEGFDWIAEGLAEYYGIELMRRGKALTEKRAASAFERQANWGGEAETLCAQDSTASATALAVSLFKRLDGEIVDKTERSANLDALLPQLVGETVDLAALTNAVATVIGSTPDTLHIDNLPGCRTIQ